MKGKGEKERYSHLNAEFQRIARRDKKAFFSDQCKEIEEKNRIGKTRDLFNKIRDTNGTFHVKMGTIKDRNSVFDSVCDRNRLCIVACLFDLYVEYTMQNAGLDEAQAGIMISWRNINNLNMQMTPPLWQKVKRN